MPGVFPSIVFGTRFSRSTVDTIPPCCVPSLQYKDLTVIATQSYKLTRVTAPAGFGNASHQIDNSGDFCLCSFFCRKGNKEYTVLTVHKSTLRRKGKAAKDETINERTEDFTATDSDSSQNSHTPRETAG